MIDSLVNLYMCWDFDMCNFENHLAEKDIGVSTSYVEGNYIRSQECIGLLREVKSVTFQSK